MSSSVFGTRTVEMVIDAGRLSVAQVYAEGWSTLARIQQMHPLLSYHI